MNVEQTGFKTAEIQEIAEIGETLQSIAVLWLEDPGNQITIKPCDNFFPCVENHFKIICCNFLLVRFMLPIFCYFT